MTERGSIAQRRVEILTAAARVFSRKGYRLTDVQEIADILKLGKGTVYRYFSSKRKLFTSIIEQGMHQLMTEIHQQMAEVTNPLERLRAAIRTHVEFFSRNLDLVELFIQERSEFKEHFRPLYRKYYQQHQKGVERIIRDCIDQGLIKPTSPAAVASVLSDLYYGVLFTAYLGGKRDTLKLKGQYILDVFLNNITN